MPFPSPGDLPNQGIKPQSPALLVNSLQSEPPGECKTTCLIKTALYEGFPGSASGEEPDLQCKRLKRLGFDPCVKLGIPVYEGKDWRVHLCYLELVEL